MASKIILKKSSVAAKAPVAGDLEFGELAINYTDSKLYFKKADGSIDAFTSAAASAPVTSVGGNIGAVTDAQLLASIKNVDGAGSGLDADFLDGLNASAFYLASNPNGYTSNTGTVTSVGATAPLVSSGGTAPSISIPAATSTTNGYMSSAYASKLDGIAAGATANTGTVTSVSGTGTVSGLTLTGTVTGSGSLTLGGTLTLTSAQVTTALGYTPYNSTNPNGYITSSSSISGTSAGLSGGDSTFYARIYNGLSGDLNTYNDPGLYSAEYTGTTNRPVASNGHYIQISDAGGTDVKTQWYFEGTGVTPYMRLMYGNGAWKSWQALLTNTNVSSYALVQNTWQNSKYFGTDGAIYGTIFYDSNNSGYYSDPSGASRLGTVNADTLRSYNNIYLDNNYGSSIIGVYSSYRYQGVFSMGDAYKLPLDGTTTGNLYGLAWSHPNAGGTAGNLNTHGLLVLENGGFLAAVSGSIRSRDDMRTPIYYDSNDTGYYSDPNTTGVAYRGRGQILLGPNTSSRYFRIGGDGGATDYSTITVSNGNLHLDAQTGYNIYLAWYNTSNVNVGGGVVANGNITAYSDERLKKDWLSLPVDYIERLAKVKNGTYTRTDNENRQAGSSAQDWQLLLPEVVEETGDDKTLSLAYGNAALVSTIELAKRVVEQNTRIARLEELISKLIDN